MKSRIQNVVETLFPDLLKKSKLNRFLGHLKVLYGLFLLYFKSSAIEIY